jgi:hypothetical protein
MGHYDASSPAPTNELGLDLPVRSNRAVFTQPRRARLPRNSRAPVMAPLFVALLLVFALPAGRVQRVSAAPAGNDAITPQALVQALASTPLSASELPAAFSPAGDPQDVSGEVAGIVPGVTGAVLIPVSGGSSAVAALGYGVFDTADDASAAFNANLSLVPGLEVTSSSVPSGFDAPAMLYNGSISAGGFGGIGASACAVLEGNVVVVGVSAQFLSAQGSPDDACAIAQAGITHLANVSGA